MPLKGSGRKPDCHPDRAHHSKGLCGPCYRKERTKRYRESGKAKELWDRYYNNPKNKEKILRNEREKRYRRLYGITIEEFDRKMAVQGGTCMICKATTPGRDFGHFLVDHDHKTGKARDLLCVRCNWAVAIFENTPEIPPLVEEYLRRHNGGSAVE